MTLDPESLTVRVFVTNVRAKYKHWLQVYDADMFLWAECTECGLHFGSLDRLLEEPFTPAMFGLHRASRGGDNAWRCTGSKGWRNG